MALEVGELVFLDDLRTQEVRDPLLESDHLDDGAHDLPGFLENPLVIPGPVQLCQFVADVVVQTHEHHVEGRERRMFVDSIIT